VLRNGVDWMGYLNENLSASTELNRIGI
jgi:hypothetical protein